MRGAATPAPTGRAGRAAAFAAAAVVLAGCAIGPDYKRPELPTTETFRAQAAAESASFADLSWWEVFRDEALGSLVHVALEENLDLEVAIARLEQSRSEAAVTRSEFFPDFGYAAGGRLGNDRGGLDPAAGSSTRKSYFGVANVAWELDVWGRIRRSNEASRADLLASDAVRRGVVLSLVSSVAQKYFELRELDLELEIARATVASFEDTLNIFQRQFEGGVASKLDALRVEAARAQAAATIPEIERLIFAKENELALLLGRPPSEMPRGAALVDQWLPPEIPAGVPSDLLARRPDLVEIEQRLVSENALVGVTLAEFFPRIGLTSFGGAASDDLSRAADSGVGLWSFAGEAAGRLFTFGRNYYTYKRQKSAVDAAVSTYERTLLVALKEVSDALVEREKLEQVRVEQERAVEALRESVRIAIIRYKGGLASYLEVLDAQQQLFPAENALARTRLRQLSTVVTLYRALGGGWSQDQSIPTVPSPLAP